MKKIFYILILCFISIGVLAQAPQSFNYQAVLRNDAGEPIASQDVTVKIDILKGSLEGEEVFTETHNPETNDFGLVTLKIGSKESIDIVDWGTDDYFVQVSVDGTPMGTTQLLSVPYAFYAQTTDETDPKFNASPAADIEATDIESWGEAYLWGNHADGDYLSEEVDPVFEASPAAGIEATDIDNWEEAYLWGNHADEGYITEQASPQNLAGVLQVGNNAKGQNITSLADPNNDQDAATKSYVDELIVQVMNSFSGENESYTSSTTGKLTDVDENTYNIVKIGSQWWMAENLRTTKYDSGNNIENITDNTNWQTTSEGAWSYYDNDSQYNEPYGKLYNWYAVDDQRNICPTGWRAATDEDWTILTDYLGGSEVAGGKLKDKGTTYWNSPNSDATNEVGFTALPGGFRLSSGSFRSMGDFGRWWTSTQSSNDNAFHRHMAYDHAEVYDGSSGKNMGYSVRCVKK